jgi:hypothetical protein
VFADEQRVIPERGSAYMTDIVGRIFSIEQRFTDLRGKPDFRVSVFLPERERKRGRSVLIASADGRLSTWMIVGERP